MNKPLSPTRAKDRDAIAANVAAIAANFGATMTREDLPDFTSLDVRTTDGLHAYVWLEHRGTNPETFMVNWVSESRRIAPHFAPSVNSSHWKKATDFAAGMPALAALLATRLHSAATGAAFQPESVPA